MSSEVAIHNGKAHVVYGSGAAAWHGEGNVLPDLMTSEEVDDEVQWPEIDVVPAMLEIPVPGANGETRFVPAKLTHEERNKSGETVVKTDSEFMLTIARWRDGVISPLGQVSERWNPVQARAAFRIFDPIVEELGACYDAAGILKGGRTFWVLARLPEKFDMESGGKIDRSVRYLLFMTNNDGSGSAIVKPTWVRVVCNNTLSLALKGKGNEIRIRHTGDIDAKIEDARGVVKSAMEQFKATEESFRLMEARKLTPEARGKFVADVLGIDLEKDLTTRSKNILGDVADILNGGKGTTEFPGQRETLWGTLNAITEFVDHKRVVRNEASIGRLETTCFGAGSKVKDRAYEIAIRLLADGTEVEVPIEVDAPTDPHGEDFAALMRQ